MATNASFRFPDFQKRFSLLRGDMTQAEFADFLGLSRPTVGLYESGQRIPDAQVLKRIAEKCGVSADYLLGLTTVESSSLSVRKICDLTGLSEITVKTLIADMERRDDKNRSTFPLAFADIFFSEENESDLLEVEADIIQAAMVQHFHETKEFEGVLSFDTDDLRRLYTKRASEKIQRLIDNAINRSVDFIASELEREQAACEKIGTPPDADFQDLAYGKSIKDSDGKERK